MIKMKLYLTLCFLLCCVIKVDAYRHYQKLIPNGERVPHPCKPNYVWHGVGHEKPEGAGKRNPFGVQFAEAGRIWKNVCNLDSDGDGLTNGQELGDPNCIWAEGDIPQRDKNITHPGVCDPVDSPTCRAKNEFVDCNPEADFQCDALNETETRNITVRFPETAIPPSETNYYCMVFELPQDDDYHLVANIPHIDNKYVMHHIVLFGCDESNGPVTRPLNVAEKCGMGDPKCNQVIALWSVGLHGECLNKDIGIPFGATKGYKKAMLQIHWNNPELRADYKDSSGMVLYYTSKRRKYDSGVLLTGQTYLQIPPRQERVVQEGTCSPDCTRRQITGSIFITRGFNHMHYMGREMKIEVLRNGVNIANITNEKYYNYDSPVMFEPESPIEVLPGDEIRTTCVYTSRYKTETTLFGESTQEEMCFGFLTYHPVQNMPFSQCTSWKSLSTYKIWYKPESFPEIDGCRWRDFLNTSHPVTKAAMKDVLSKCKPFECLPECKETIIRIQNHSCLNNDIGFYLRHYISHWSWNFQLMQFLAAIDSCKLELNQNTCNRNSTRGSNNSSDGNVGGNGDGYNPQHNSITTLTPYMFNLLICLLFVTFLH